MICFKIKLVLSLLVGLPSIHPKDIRTISQQFPAPTDVNVLYDISCILKPHLQVDILFSILLPHSVLGIVYACAVHSSSVFCSFSPLCRSSQKCGLICGGSPSMCLYFMHMDTRQIVRYLLVCYFVIANNMCELLVYTLHLLLLPCYLST